MKIALLKETSHEISSQQNVFLYKESDFTKKVKELFQNYKDFECDKIQTEGEGEWWNITIKYSTDELDMSTLEDKRYVVSQKIQKFKLDFFSEISRYFPVININVAGYQTNLNEDEIKFVITVLMSKTKNRDWVNGKVTKVEKMPKEKIEENQIKKEMKKNELSSIKKILEGLECRVDENSAMSVQKDEKINSATIRKVVETIALKIKGATRSGNKTLVNELKAKLENWFSANGLDYMTNPYAAELLAEQSKSALKAQGKKPILDSEELGSEEDMHDFGDLSGENEYEWDISHGASGEDTFLTSENRNSDKYQTLFEDDLHEDLDKTQKTELVTLAKQHIKNERKLIEFKEKIEALKNEMNAYDNSGISTKIITLLEQTEEKSYKTGKIFVKLNIEEEMTRVNNTPKYKSVVEKLKKLIATETELIENTVIEFTPNKQPEKIITKSITATQNESKKVKSLKENKISDFWNKIKTSLKSRFINYFNEVDEITAMVNALTVKK